MRKISTLLPAFLLMGPMLFAAHLPGGNITYTCVGENQYAVTLTLFRDCAGSPLAPQDLLFANDCGTSFTMTALPVGEGLEVSQLCPSDLPNSSCNGGELPGTEVYQVDVTVPLGPCDGWRISWHECCRSNSLNLVGQPGTYIEATLNSVTAPCNNSPAFTQDVIPYVCVQEPVNYNLAVTEQDGHELRYRLIGARQLETASPVNYSSSLNGAVPYTGLVIDSLTGQISFTPTELGNVVVVVRVDEYTGDGQHAGSVMRDFPFVVISCPNSAPDPSTGQITGLTGEVIDSDDMALSMCTYGNFCFDITISDADAAQGLTLSSNISTVLPAATFTTSGNNPITATICWNEEAIAPGSYGLVITAEDDACPTTGLTTYAYTLTVLTDSDAACLGTRIDPAPNKADEWTVWPVPATDQLMLHHTFSAPATLQVYDMQGRLVHSRTVPPGLSPIDMSAQGPGPYMLHLQREEKELRKKIMIAP